MKSCIDCKEEKPLEDFYENSYVRKDGTRAKKSCCKSCDNKRAVAWQTKNPERFRVSNRRYHFQSRYGLTLEQYEDMTKDGCYVCGSDELLNIDHDHACCPGVKSCGKCVRGVLCRRHNWVVGNLNDSLEEVEAVKDYLLTYCGRGPSVV